MNLLTVLMVLSLLSCGFCSATYKVASLPATANGVDLAFTLWSSFNAISAVAPSSTISVINNTPMLLALTGFSSTPFLMSPSVPAGGYSTYAWVSPPGNVDLYTSVTFINSPADSTSVLSSRTVGLRIVSNSGGTALYGYVNPASWANPSGSTYTFQVSQSLDSSKFNTYSFWTVVTSTATYTIRVGMTYGYAGSGRVRAVFTFDDVTNAPSQC